MNEFVPKGSIFLEPVEAPPDRVMAIFLVMWAHVGLWLGMIAVSLLMLYTAYFVVGLFLILAGCVTVVSHMKIFGVSSGALIIISTWLVPIVGPHYLAVFDSEDALLADLATVASLGMLGHAVAFYSVMLVVWWRRGTLRLF